MTTKRDASGGASCGLQGPARRALYDTIGRGYSDHRRPDPRIAARIETALGGAETIVNVGAGTGSYEPTGRRLLAVEPSMRMISQRPPSAAPVVRAVADRLPLTDRSFDAALALLTIHHWVDLEAGLRELRRVARDRVVILTCDSPLLRFWLVDYFPEIPALDAKAMPALSRVAAAFAHYEIIDVPVPHDCSDGFLGAYWRRPEAYLDAGVRQAISMFAMLPQIDRGISALRGDLESGAWTERYGDLLTRDALDLGYRIVVGRLG